MRVEKGRSNQARTESGADQMRDGGIAKYYSDIDKKQAAAYDVVQAAIKSGEPEKEIKRLKELAHDAGNTGD